MATGRGNGDEMRRQQTGVLDLGAESSSIPVRVADKTGEKIHVGTAQAVTYVYGNNEKLTSVGEQHMGESVP